MDDNLKKYIAESKEKGLPNEEIIKNLINFGWNKEVVDAELNGIKSKEDTKTEKKSSNGRIYFIFGIIILLIAGTLFGFLTFYGRSKEALSTDFSNCKNMSCFAQAAINCDDVNASIINKSEVIDYLNVTYTADLKLSHGSQGLCSLGIQFRVMHVMNSTSSIEFTRSVGISERILQERLLKNNIFVVKINNSENSCKFSPNEIRAMAHQWNRSNFLFTYRQFTNGHCQGDAFGDSLLSCKPCGNCSSGKQKLIEIDSVNKCVECYLNTDCIDGFECTYNRCHPIDLRFYLTPCDVNKECHETCEHCLAGKKKCILSSDKLKNNLCIDCLTDSTCAENYVCRNYICILNETFLP